VCLVKSWKNICPLTAKQYTESLSARFLQKKIAQLLQIFLNVSTSGSTTLTILSREQHVIISVDFSEAFDVVSHPKLFARLNSYGIRGIVAQF